MAYPMKSQSLVFMIGTARQLRNAYREESGCSTKALASMFERIKIQKTLKILHFLR